MTGAEIATIAAAESPDPAKAIAKATNSVIARIAVFYVGSIFLLAVILPWNSSALAASPYVAAFQAMGIPYADQYHERGSAHRRAFVSELGSVHRFSVCLFVLSARRGGTDRSDSGQQDRGTADRDPGFQRHRFSLCDRRGDLSGDGVLVPAELLRRRHLFIYLLIAISQVVLRRRTSEDKLIVKMWLFPCCPSW